MSTGIASYVHKSRVIYMYTGAASHVIFNMNK